VQKPTSADFRALFASHGLRYTRQRAALYATLAGTTSHPTAEELFEMTRREFARGNDGRVPARGLSLSTVYNALETLVDRGLCRRMTCPGGVGTPGARGAGPCRFDADVSEHIHVVMADGSVRDVPGAIADRVLAGLFGAGEDSQGNTDSRVPSQAQAASRGIIGDVERAMGVRIKRASLQLIAEA